MPVRSSAVSPGSHLPSARLDNPSARTAVADRVLPRAAPVDGVGKAIPDPLVLIVDDDKTMCDFLAFVLLAEGYRVTRAQDGIEALEKAISLRPNLIMMDLCLPRLDGIEAIRRLKALETTKSIPMLALTGFPTENDDACERAREAGCDAFFTKAAELDGLMDMIYAMVRTGGDLLTRESA